MCVCVCVSVCVSVCVCVCMCTHMRMGVSACMDAIAGVGHITTLSRAPSTAIEKLKLEGTVP